ncbi:kinase-like domain-containing protein [Mycena olivaceomarginata]|nr:kinase-like domain-containing protein [Mycena olivaceomarginata]
MPRILVYEALILYLKEACSAGIPGYSPREVTQIQVTLDGYLLSMASDNPVVGIVRSVEYRKTLLELSSKLGLEKDSNLRAALRKDGERITTLLLSIFTSKSLEAAVLRLEGDHAQCFLDVVQSGFLMTPEHSRMARRIIRKLSASCDTLPTSLFITGITGKDQHPTFGGAYGDIYRASYNQKPVALKYMRAVHFMRGSDLRRIRLKFCREALVWRALHHKNILPCLGIDGDSFPSSLCMVSPWMEHGTIMNYLEEYGHGNVDKLLYEVAQGLEYLHLCGIVHGDLRGTNILIAEDWSACLADFGLSIFSDATASMTTNRAGSLYWMAPELLDPDRLENKFRTPASDVYAFGCVCLELYTGRPPFADLPEPGAMMKVIKGQRPERPSGPPAMSDILWQHVTEFWSNTPSARPTTQIVVQNMLWPSPELKPKHPLPAVPETLLSVPSFSDETALPPRKHSNIDNGVGQFRVIRQGHVSVRANSTFASRFWWNKWLVLTETSLTLYKSKKSNSPIHLIMLGDIVKIERTDLKPYCFLLETHDRKRYFLSLQSGQ